MKFANYVFNARGINNLGDNMQIIAIDFIYHQMGIKTDDIVYIDKNELSSYNGGYVILPVTMPLIDYTEGGISGRFSDHIVPVFLGLSLVKDTFLQEEIEYYHRYEPIGCRDERTMNTLRANGVQAYLHGCPTASLPKRSLEGKKPEKVFIVDAPDELIPLMPHKIKKDAVFITHFHSEIIENPKEMMQQYYDLYKSEARLVITSLLHCSVPCMAAGIPVIIVKKHISYRFGWLEKLVRLYDAKDFSSIDWNPVPVEYEDHKKRLLKITINRLNDAYSKYRQIYDLSWFYEDRNKMEYIIDAFESIKRYIDSYFVDKNASYEYSIWGLTQISNLTVNYISKNFPNAKLMHVYDKYRKVTFEGLRSESPEMIREYPNDIIIVTTNGAKEDAMTLFNEIGKDNNNYVFAEIIK